MAEVVATTISMILVGLASNVESKKHSRSQHGYPCIAPGEILRARNENDDVLICELFMLWNNLEYLSDS